MRKESANPTRLYNAAARLDAKRVGEQVRVIKRYSQRPQHLNGTIFIVIFSTQTNSSKRMNA